MPSTPRPSIRVYVFDVDRQPIPNATIEAVPFRFPWLRRFGPRLIAKTCRFLCALCGRRPCNGARPLTRNRDWGVFTASLEPGMYTLRVSSDNLEAQSRAVRVTARGLRAVFIMAPAGTPYYYRGKTRVAFRSAWSYGIAVKPAYRGLSLEQLAARSAPPVDLAGLDYATIAGDGDFFNDDHGIRLYQSSPKDGADFESRVRRITGVESAGLIVRQSSRAVSFLTDEFVFRLRPGADVPEIIRTSGFTIRPLRMDKRLWAVRAPSAHSVALLELCNRVAALADEVTAGVMWAEPNLYSNTIPWTGGGFSDANALRTQQPHHVLLRTEQAWQTTTGALATIAVIDRGCDRRHPFIHIDASYDFLQGQQAVSANPHGTACCGLAVAKADHANNYSGVAPAAKLIVASRHYGSDIHFADAFLWCGQLPTVDPIPPCALAADVISCSWDLDDVEPAGAVKLALDDLWAKNIVVVFASGNDGASFSTTKAGAMAAYPLNIAVGSSSTVIAANSAGAAIAPTLAQEHRVQESDFGPELDVVAPGGGILDPADGTTNAPAPGAAYAMFAETSCACPQVAGVVALIQSAYREANGLALSAPALTAQQVRDILTATADQIPSSSAYASGVSADCGFGRVNAASAVGQVGAAPALSQPAAAVSPVPLEYDYQFELE
ncbi:MAG TPA: S8 family serine peptidase [Vicinamibacterales bacterium]|nr:S8 family serine peptidase [Vicinamibacterales bacterium]